MEKKKLIRTGIILTIGLMIIGTSTVVYLFNMPHRNIQSAKTDFEITVASLVSEYLSDPTAADEKYLDEEGESKILEVTGTVSKISEDFNGQLVLLLKDPEGKAGVSCTILSSSKSVASQIQKGETIKVKGVIRSGAFFDKDLDMYENAIMEKCDIVSKI